MICISTGALEFFNPLCVKDFENRMEKESKSMLTADFIFGPNFGCLHISWRLVVILIMEHVFIGAAYVVMTRIPRVPNWIQTIMNARETKFKEMLKHHEPELFGGKVGFRRRNSNNKSANREFALDDDDDKIPLGPPPQMLRTLSLETPTSADALSDLEDDDELPMSTGGKARSREELALRWANGTDVV